LPVSPCGKGLAFALPSGIQIILSPAGPGTGFIAIIVQSHCILLSVLFSINRQQLSLFDANHALLLASSPLAVEVVLTCIEGLFGFHPGHIRIHPRTIYTFGALLLPLWFGLRLTLRLSSWAFIDGEFCSNPTFKDLLELPLITTLEDSDPSFLLFVTLFYFCRWDRKLARQMLETFPAQEETYEPQGRSRTLWTSVSRAWYVPATLGA